MLRKIRLAQRLFATYRPALGVAALSLFGLSVWLTACHRDFEKPADILAAEKTLPEKVDYNLHVKPILSDRCFACHGPDQAKQQAGLRLDTEEGAYAALAESGHTAIVPGDLARSELAHRITATDPDEMMPTPKSNLSLTAEEKALLLRWVEQGAEYKPHWSLVAATRPDVPNVAGDRWSRNAIDKFVAAKFQEKKLRPAPEADKLTLLRRVTLDLTGLPPTPAEVDAFMADTSPTAYEHVVDRLLRSPRYGERQAVDWLDVARYADTHGYQDDGLRTMWPYRDWVIRAYNQNLRFDKFVTWQLAGDLLPKPSKDVMIATAFNRNHQQSQEGGIVPEEYEAAYVGDRTDTFGKAFLGLTVECARCHDHKYDPISQKDYYSLSAFFAQNNEFGQIPYNGEPSPHITLPTPAAEKELNVLKAHLARYDREQRQDATSVAKQRFATWLATAQKNPTAALLSDQQDLVIDVPFDLSRDDMVGEKKDRRRRLFLNRANDTLPLKTNGDLDFPIPFVRSPRGRGVKLVGESFLELRDVNGWEDKKRWNTTVAWFERNEPFTVGLWVAINDPKMVGPIYNRNTGYFNGFRGYGLDRLPDGRLAFRLSYVWPDNAIDLETEQPLPLHRWMHVAVAYDGRSRADGVKLYINGQAVALRAVTDNLTQSIKFGKDKSTWGAGAVNFSIGQMHDHNYKGYSIDELRVYARKLTPLEVATLSNGRNELIAALKAPERTPAQETALYDYYVTNVDGPARQRRLARQQTLGRITDLMGQQPDVMVMRERSVPRPTHILKRGAYDAPGDAVSPEAPHQLPKLPDDAPKNRLGLARWLLSAENPLFARVMVNRVWQQYFGQGLAKNSDDFGNQGALPSHPELLDWLAVTFREGNGRNGPWNVKALHRLIVTSATYRQSSNVPLRHREQDYDNTYLARGPSYRLGAEQVRDGALAASGLLNKRIGGPSVHPYQPAGIWEALATRNAINYVQNHGDSLYRRSMYTIWKRSSPPPMMLNFDAAERHVCTVKRQKTSTPLQALVTLNDPQFVEAARVLAQKEGGKKRAERDMVNAFFKSVVSRPARPDEVRLMTQLYQEELTDFRKNPARAKELLNVGEFPVDKTLPPDQLAAWTVVASTVMNFDEAIIKR